MFIISLVIDYTVLIYLLFFAPNIMFHSFNYFPPLFYYFIFKLESDFNQLYPDKENIFFVKYLEMAPNIFKTIKSKNDLVIKENVKAFLESDDDPSEGKYIRK